MHQIANRKTAYAVDRDQAHLLSRVLKRVLPVGRYVVITISIMSEVVWFVPAPDGWNSQERLRQLSMNWRLVYHAYTQGYDVDI
jgi:hypothetical protein